MRFEDVIGQHDVKNLLTQMIDEGHVPHAIMLCGPQGCGKLALAVAFAEMLCDTRVNIHFTYPIIRTSEMSSNYSPSSLDFAKEWVEMTKDGYYFSLNSWLKELKAENQQASIFTGESVAILHKLSLSTAAKSYKACVMWLPEKMNGECANKLLKMLEEPPVNTIFILVSEEPESLLETIRSRTQRIDVKKIADKDIMQALQERCGVNETDAKKLTHIANGSWLKVMELLETENENTEFLELFISLMRMCYKRDIRGLKTWSEEAAKMGREKQKRLLNYIQRLVRENFIYNFHNEEMIYMTQAEENFAANFARFINENNVVEINNLLEDCQRDVARNANIKVLFFDFVLKMTILLLKK